MFKDISERVEKDEQRVLRTIFYSDGKFWSGKKSNDGQMMYDVYETTPRAGDFISSYFSNSTGWRNQVLNEGLEYDFLMSEDGYYPSVLREAS